MSDHRVALGAVCQRHTDHAGALHLGQHLRGRVAVHGGIDAGLVKRRAAGEHHDCDADRAVADETDKVLDERDSAVLDAALEPVATTYASAGYWA